MSPQDSRCRPGNRVSRRSFAVVGLIFLTTCLGTGIVRTIWVFYQEISWSIQTTGRDIAIAFAVLAVFTFCPALAVGVVYRRLRHSYARLVLVLGSLLPAASVVLISFTGGIVGFTACFAAVGLGSSMSTVASLLELDAQAGAYFGLLLSIGLAGYAVGMIIFPLLGHALLHIYGWRGVILIMGGLMAFQVPVALLIIPQAQESSNLAKRQLTKTNGTVPSRSRGKSRRRRTEQHKRAKNARNHYPLVKSSDSKSDAMMELNSLRVLSEEYSDETSRLVRLTDSDSSEISVFSREGDHSIQSPESPRCHPTHSEQTTNHVLQRKSSENIDSIRSKMSTPHTNGNLVDSTPDRVGERSNVDTSQGFCLPLLRAVVVDYSYLTTFLAAILFYGIVSGGWQMYVVPHAIGRDDSVLHEVTLSCVAAASDLLGRVLMAIVSDRYSDNLMTIFILATIVSAGALLFDALFYSFHVMLLTTILTQLSISTRSAISIVILREQSQRKNFDILVGVQTFAFGAGSLLGVSVGRLLVERFDMFNAAFTMLAICEIPNLLLAASSSRLYHSKFGEHSESNTASEE